LFGTSLPQAVDIFCITSTEATGSRRSPGRLGVLQKDGDCFKSSFTGIFTLYLSVIWRVSEAAMFEAVTITSDNIDEGTIAEALVYYGQVHVVLSRGGLQRIAKSFGRDNLVRLVDAGNLKLSYERSNYAVNTNSAPFRTHDFGVFALAGTAEGRKIRNPRDDIEELFYREFGKSRTTKIFARDVADRVAVPKVRDEILKSARLDILDSDYMTRACAAWLKVMVPEYELPKLFTVETADTGQGFVFLSGLDFEEINKFYHRRFPPEHSSVTDSYLLAHIVGVRKELSFSAGSRTDIWLGPGNAAMLREKTDKLLKRTTKSRRDISIFHDVEFEGKTFREVVNNGQRSIGDIVTFLELEDTRRFRTWLISQSNETMLIKEFHRTLFEKTGWMQMLPTKLLKLVVFAGLGAAIDAEIGSMGFATAVATGLGIASNVLVGASDEFLLSRMGTGWKPTQFVETSAHDFLLGSDEKSAA
jgi:hypothetical protein